MFGNNRLPTTTKRDLARQVAAKCGIDIEVAEKSIEATLESIRRAVGAGGRVELRKFGVFRPRYVRERISGINPHTGRPVHIKACVRFSFKTACNLHSLKVGQEALKKNAR
jgi:nucleoid DNA-binding protein